MRLALRLAARGSTSPNPMVGCVIVRDGQIVGEGFHTAAGAPHAEPAALESAGPAARGADVYVTLEPCAHHGRTPPCADALIGAGVRRVFAAMLDPDPRVRGRGIERLRAAGISVAVGLLEQAAREQNEAFLHAQSFGRPFVTLKGAASLDGKIAAASGHSQWITGPAARSRVHQMRATAGAVLTSSSTLIADDAALTARPRTPVYRQPLRVVVDSRLRTPPGSRAVRLAGEGGSRLLIATIEPADPVRLSDLTRAGAKVLELPPGGDGRVDLEALMLHLCREEGVTGVMVEAGGELNAAFLALGLAHKVVLFIAPLLVGGRTAPTFMEGDGAARVDEGEPLGDMRVQRAGRDFMVTAYTRAGMSAREQYGAWNDEGAES